MMVNDAHFVKTTPFRGLSISFQYFVSKLQTHIEDVIEVVWCHFFVKFIAF